MAESPTNNQGVIVDIDAEKLIEQSIRKGIAEAVSQAANRHDSPLLKGIANAMLKMSPEIEELIADGLRSAISDGSFREYIKENARSILAKQLVQKLGGEFEKKINELKSNPATRARITLAIEEIVKTA